MAQGFKPSKGGSSKKGKSSPKGPKQGFGRVIAPKKKAAVQQASQKRKQQASLTQKIESDMAGRAAGGGPLGIMKKIGDAANKSKQEEKEKKLANARTKGRPQ